MRVGGLGMMRLASGGHIPMGAIAVNDAMHGMPGMIMPDYMMNRLADGGMPDPYAMRRAAYPMHRGISANAPPIDLQGERMYDSRSKIWPWRDGQEDSGVASSRGLDLDPPGESRRRHALSDLGNAGLYAKASDEDMKNMWHDVVASMASPTDLPLSFFSGIKGAKSFLTTMGIMNAMPPQIGDAGPDGESRQWGAYEQPSFIDELRDLLFKPSAGASAKFNRRSVR